MNDFDNSGITLNRGEARMLQELFCSGGDYGAFVANLRHQIRMDDIGTVQRGGVEKELRFLLSAVTTLMRGPSL